MTNNVKNSTFNSKNGRYVMGGITEVSIFAIESWEMFEMQRDPTDIIYAMEKKYEGRPDLLGYVFYGDPGLWWVLCQFNGILDPMSELVEGKLLAIPLLDRVKKEMRAIGSKPGGVKSTRIKT